MARAQGANTFLHAAFETSYGTPPSSGYYKLPFVSHALGAEQGLIEDDRLGLGRAPGDPTYDVVTNDGDVVVPLDVYAFPRWLILLLGNPSSMAAGTGLYQHIFSSGAGSLPSFSVEVAHTDISKYSTHYGLRGSTMNIQMGRSGLASATLGLIGKGETVLSNTSNAGVVGSPGDYIRFASASGLVTIDGQQVGEVVSANISFSNGLDKDETIRPDGEINDVDVGMPTASLQLVTKFAEAALATKANSRTPVSISLKWTTPQGFALIISFPRLFLPRTKRPVSGPKGVQISSNTIAASNPQGTLMAVSVINDVASYA